MDKINICSNALMIIGDNPINSFTDSGAGAMAANQLYDSAYETMLASHRWTFAHAKVQLSKLAQSPLNTWQNAFQIPTNQKLIMIFGVYPDAPYDIIQDTIYSNREEVAIDYIFKPDESKLPGTFITALQLQLASLFAVFITDDNTLSSMYAEQAVSALEMAKSIDSQSRTVQPIRSAPFIAVR